MKKRLIFLVAFVLPNLLSAGGDPLSVRWQGERLTLMPSAETARMYFEDGTHFALPDLNQAEFSSLVHSGSSWLALGTERDGDSRRELVAFRGDRNEVHEFPVPRHQKGNLRHGGQFLVENGILRGMVFFEGPSRDRLDLWYSRWNGRRWKRPRRIAPAVHGSQLSLSAAVLADGSWLVVWSRFDGTDDEVFWTQRIGDQFTPIRRVAENNEVPDINPVLVTTPEGALLAWSRWDNEGYRLHLARFESGGFEPPRPAGPLGSLYPSFEPSEQGCYLLYLEAVPRSWAVAALDDRGQVQARARLQSTSRERPVLSFSSSSEVILKWLGKSISNTLDMVQEP